MGRRARCVGKPHDRKSLNRGDSPSSPATRQVSHRFQMPNETAWDLGAILIFDNIEPAFGGQFIWNLAQNPLPCVPAQNSLMRKLVEEKELRHD